MPKTVEKNVSVPGTQGELKKRVITGLSGVALLIAIIIWGGFYGALLIALVISLAMIAEFVNMSFSLRDIKLKRAFLMTLSFVLGTGYFLIGGPSVGWIVLGVLLIFGYFLFTAHLHAEKEFSTHVQEMILALFAGLYLVVLPYFLPALRAEPNGMYWTLFFFLVIWACDTGAYFAGKAWGKTKLYSQVSPKKTWEGIAGGLVACVIVAIIARLLFLSSASYRGLVIMALVLGVVSQIGDLCESLLKRGFDKKDSGTVLPGHGGFLDRFDSVVFALPIMYALVRSLS